MNSGMDLIKRISKDLLQENIRTINKIEGGLNNNNFLINGKYLVKQYLMRDEQNDPVYLRFLREEKTLKLLNENHHVPKLINSYKNPPNLFIVREWVFGKVINLNQVSKYLSLIIDALSSLYTFNNSFKTDFDYLNIIRRYMKVYKNIESLSEEDSSQFLDFSSLPRYDLLTTFFNEQFDKIKNLNSLKSTVRIHGDLVLSNIILMDNKTHIMFIDWEYSTLGTPMLDLAYFLSQNRLSESIQQEVIKQYRKKTSFSINERELQVYYDLMNLMSGLWFVIHASRLKHIKTNINGKMSYKHFIKLAMENFKGLKILE